MYKLLKIKFRFLWLKLNLVQGLIISFCIILLIFGSAFICNQRFDYVIPKAKTTCIEDFNFGIIDKWQKKIEVDNKYAFLSKHMVIRADGTLLVKYFRAQELDEAGVSNNQEIFINSHQAGHGLIHAEALNTNPNIFVRNEILDFGEFWALGTKFDSFDSRYWGDVNENQVVGRFYPVF